ncbi:MAG: aminodeoxychorismate synthase component [Actinomycetota bacterium]
MPLHHESLHSWTSVADTFSIFFAHHPNSFWLDREHHPTARFSIIGVGTISDSPDFSLSGEEADLPFPFRPHLVGVVHYSNEPGQIQGFDLLEVDRAFVFDHDRRRLHFVGRFDTRKEFEAWHHAALLRLALIGGDSAAHQLNRPAATSAKLVCLDQVAGYKQKIEASKDAIARGEVYQICLTTALEGDYQGDELSFFLRLRRQNPAPYAAFIRVGGKTFVSISPERFITVTGSAVTSSPIKGTRPRGNSSEADEILRSELSLSQKEQAENLMIVDLVRNDLSQVCKPESVAVSSLMQVQSYSTVHQLVSDVRAELRDGLDGTAALKALLPGGSMTGAPKRRAMQLLAELESRDRGPYSGGIGWIGYGGEMDLGMVIRTAIFENGKVRIDIGGGITSDSEPEAEHQEIQVKARALVAALSASVDW